jgi:broad specificity phosphatase PhoE
MSDRTELYLIRHAEATNNVSNLIAGQSPELPLTDNGFDQAEYLGRVLLERGLIPDQVFSSPAVRAKQTGKTALRAMGLELDIVEDDRLLEQGTGDWTGRVATEIFTDETLGEIGRLGKEFKSPGGESMNEVGQRMYDWMTGVKTEGRVFAFTHGGPIRCLPSHMYDWPHEQTYQTQPGNTSVSLFVREGSEWRLEYLGKSPDELEIAEEEPKLHAEIRARLVENEQIRESLESIVWFGSVRNEQDVHSRSDCDLQIILDAPDFEVTMQMNQILEDYPDVDLSIMYLKDIYDHEGNVIFHDGTKGLFFVNVLAAGQVVYGKNVYADIVENLTLDDIKPSLLVTIREYLSRLRVMAVQEVNDTLRFKKYSLKLFKDLMVYNGAVPFRDISKITNDEARDQIQSVHGFAPESVGALSRISDYTHNFGREEMARLLCDYETIIEGVCNE